MNAPRNLITGSIVAMSLWLMLPVLMPSERAHAAFPGSNGRVAFTMARGGDHDIFSVGPDGSGLINVTTSRIDEYWPTWSPDGTKIAFVGPRMGIYSVNADGTDRTKIVDSTCIRCRAPTWSPDGTKIAFQHAVDGNLDIYVVNVDGTNLVRLTDDPAVDVQPAWSPDGSKIAFKSRRHPRGDIFVMNADGTNPSAMTDSRGRDFGPDWSPDGSQIVFASNHHANTDIFIVDADGTNERHLTDTPNSWESYPGWSPNGSRIVFGRDRNIISRPISGGSRWLLSPGRGESFGPDWQAV
jgi:Tol biopolymer transport system component